MNSKAEQTCTVMIPMQELLDCRLRSCRKHVLSNLQSYARDVPCRLCAAAEESQQCPTSWRGFEARSFCRHFTRGNGPAVVMVLTEVAWFASFVCMSDTATGRQSSKV